MSSRGKATEMIPTPRSEFIQSTCSVPIHSSAGRPTRAACSSRLSSAITGLPTTAPNPARPIHQRGQTPKL